MPYWQDATIYEGLVAVADREPDRTALVWRGRETSYRDLVARSRRLAAGLVALGVGEGDTVAVWLRNRPAWLEAQLATSLLGAAVVAVNTRYRTHELEYLLDDAAVSVLLTESSFLGTDYVAVVASLVPALGTDVGDRPLESSAFPELAHVVAVDGADGYPGVRDYGALLDRDPTAAPAPVDDAAAPACVFYTSGTTSDPKGCPQTNRSLLEHSYKVGEHFDLGADDVGLSALPLCGVMGHNAALSALAHGIPLVIQGHFDAEATLDLIEARDVTYFSAIGSMYERLVEADAFAPDRVASLEKGAVAFVNGLDEAVFERVEDAVGFPLVQPYGLSEGNSQIFVGDPDAPLEARLRVGGPLVYPEAEAARVVDPATGDPVAPGEQGELQLRGVNVIDAYLGKPDETAAALDADGWFATGDLAATDGDGTFYYRARMDDALRVRGFLVAPPEIEAAMQAHPDVESAEVVGVSHDRHGEVPVAFVIGAEGIQAAAIRDFLEGRLADYKVPAAVYPVEAFPRTEGPHGRKVRKGVLRERAAQRFQD
jgi:fatty-acyl-CoA synthase